MSSEIAGLLIKIWEVAPNTRLTQFKFDFN